MSSVGSGGLTVEFLIVFSVKNDSLMWLLHALQDVDL